MKQTFRQKFNKICLLALLVLTTGCTKKSQPVEIKKISWKTELQASTALAAQQHKPILIDFWADWCSACKELDATTFQDARVFEIIEKKTVPTQLDFTDMAEDKKAILLKYNVLGLPSLVFLDAKGRWIQEGNLSGYYNAEEFLEAFSRVAKKLNAQGVCETCS